MNVLQVPQVIFDSPNAMVYMFPVGCRVVAVP